MAAPVSVKPPSSAMSPRADTAPLFAWGERTYLVGILNLSPDSFSGDGLTTEDAALARAVRMAADGADLIDIGGESTRPGYQPVSAQEELRRTVSAITRIRCELPNLPLSIDTTKPEVAQAAFDAGASILNDIHGLRGDPALAQLAADRGITVVAMHNQRNRPPADHPICTVLAGFRASLDIARQAGICRQRIILDPGFGFGWTLRENAAILRRLRELRALGQPILVGMSRKRMTGAQHGWGVEQRIEGSAAATAIAIANGADLVRVHDVAEMSRVARIADDITRGSRHD